MTNILDCFLFQDKNSQAVLFSSEIYFNNWPREEAGATCRSVCDSGNRLDKFLNIYSTSHLQVLNEVHTGVSINTCTDVHSYLRRFPGVICVIWGMFGPAKSNIRAFVHKRLKSEPHWKTNFTEIISLFIINIMSDKHDIFL